MDIKAYKSVSRIEANAKQQARNTAFRLAIRTAGWGKIIIIITNRKQYYYNPGSRHPYGQQSRQVRPTWETRSFANKGGSGVRVAQDKWGINLQMAELLNHILMYTLK